ncbi:pilus assembly protein TadG-related protein [Streptomyces nojiriensis]|uniref:pilus assembly protein TadG-related protein n=1 Tax=Streptomyces nojiriensis TaxID=66374 RepID=UPI0036CBF72A
MSSAGSQDRGQAFPIYVVAVTGLLFAAFAFVVVGMAGATRSEAQGAADAAALAAAQEARDNAFVDMDLVVLEQDDWGKILKGDRLDVSGSACGKAITFAARNNATAMCQASRREFKVSVTTKDTVGDSVIPGSENVQGKARATAVIEPRCSLGSPTAPTPSATPSPGGGGAEAPSSIEFRCKGGAVVTLDPTKPGSLARLAKQLFSVRLAD